jgi:hypothetical protein
VQVISKETAEEMMGNAIEHVANPVGFAQFKDGIRVADDQTSAERQPTKLDRSGWGPGGRRFKSCLPDSRKPW